MKHKGYKQKMTSVVSLKVKNLVWLRLSESKQIYSFASIKFHSNIVSQKAHQYVQWMLSITQALGAIPGRSQYVYYIIYGPTIGMRSAQVPAWKWQQSLAERSHFVSLQGHDKHSYAMKWLYSLLPHID